MIRFNKAEIGIQAEDVQIAEIGMHVEDVQINSATIGLGGDDVGLSRQDIEVARKREKAHGYMSTTMKKRRS